MPDQYTLKPLDPRRIDMAFPVVQSSFPRLTIDRWRDYARAMLPLADAASNVVPLPGTEPTGIVVAQLPHGYIHGVFGYRVLHSLCHGRTLQVDVFVALNLFDPTAAAEALLLEIERTARQHRCDAIHLSLPELPDGALRGRIERIGLHMEGVRLCKSLAPAAAAE
ncbi:hypothetical protein [Indioceanicola profundi]|uniref:hypothetical protein n=1 Tax=Indioceanicola profundi TaxID=2220096 RepID=UPI000E6A9576|nr:hypothetical protein [Indioceanicola profundi]